MEMMSEHLKTIERKNLSEIRESSFSYGRAELRRSAVSKSPGRTGSNSEIPAFDVYAQMCLSACQVTLFQNDMTRSMYQAITGGNPECEYEAGISQDGRWVESFPAHFELQHKE